MIYINLIAIFTVMLMAFGFYQLKKNTTYKMCILDKKTIEKSEEWFKSGDMSMFAIIIVTAIVIRFIFAIVYAGHADINCFKYWGNILAEYGFSGFYESEGLTDYLPGYLYILRIIGGIVKTFGFDYDSNIVTILYKLPAITCDIILAMIIYKFAIKHFDKKNSLIIISMFLLNPVVILNSAVWGQIDSLLTVFVVLMCVKVYENKLDFAYICFGIGFLVKPQMAMFAPVLIFAVIERVLVKVNEDGSTKFTLNSEELFKQGAYIFMSIAATLLLCAPFGVGNVIKQCFDTMSSYEYATVNAYNFWAMLGLDWASQEDYLMFMTYRQWGTLFIIIIVFLVGIVWINNFKERSRYVIMGALLGIGTFTLSVRMHERYIFPAIILLAILFIATKKAGAMWAYIFFSAISFINCAHVLFYYDAYNFDGRAAALVITGCCQFISFIILVIYTINNYIVHIYRFERNSEILIEKPKKKLFNVYKSDKGIKFDYKDFICAGVITLIYAVIAFYNLGDKQVPQTTYNMTTSYETIDVEFEDFTYIAKMDFYLGNYEERNFNLYVSYNGEDWEYFGEMMMDSVFCWDSSEINIETKYLRLELLNDKAVINELVFKDDDGNVVKTITNDSNKALFDEQELAVEASTYRNSTIFDEIYHARTAYEFNNGLYTYEWTHPPLGKIFISWGMKLFGTTPFGWRFFGTLFGVLMLPFIYAIGKMMCKSRFFASFACTLMAVDFMHFAQTRIATIDVFVTFFVILMYVFMYWYTRMSFYDTKLIKTFIPLTLCGISFGLGCASKWTGVYAGAGLAVIFFYTMYVRYSEYKYASKDLVGISNGIKNEYINNNFWKKFWSTIAFCVLVFVIIPMIIYTLSYIPFVGNDEAPTSLVGKMLYNQKSMFDYHKDCIFEHPFSSRWYEWPIMIKPILYYSGTNPDGMQQRISSFGNPLIWWFGIAAFIFMIYLAKKYKDKTALFLVIGYLDQMLPWTLVVRTTFIYHYFTSVPFVVMMNTYFFYYITKKNKKNLKYAITFLVLSIMLFAVFYPALSGASMTEDYDKNILRWLSSWYI